jgi:CBS domain-containing protein
MQAHEIMVSPAYKVKESESVKAVIEKFIKYRIGGLPVVNERNEVTAYVSDGDIMRFIGKHENQVVGSFFFTMVFSGDNDEYEDRLKRLLALNVMEIAQKKVYKVSWNDEIEDIAALLGKQQIKKVPVERNGVLVGIISRGDVIRHSFQNSV